MAWPTESATLGTKGNPRRSPTASRPQGTSTPPVYRDVILSFEQIGDTYVVSADSVFAHPWYHWYVDGSFYRTTREPAISLDLDYAAQAEVTCIDVTDPNFDPIANAPEGYPAHYTLTWIRSLSDDTDYYIIQQNKDAAGWERIGKISDDGSTWEYRFTTDRLDDGSTYQWRIKPVDELGNIGTAITIDSIEVIRKPDAVDFDASYDADTDKITYSEAS